MHHTALVGVNQKPSNGLQMNPINGKTISKQIKLESSKLLSDTISYPTIDDNFSIEESIVKEGFTIFHISFQFCLFMIFEVGIITISTIFLGHLNESNILSLSTIGFAFTFLGTFIITSGFASCLETLIAEKSDTFYAEKSNALYIQRVFIICIIAQIPMSILLLYIPSILCTYRQDICQNISIEIITNVCLYLLPFPYFMITLTILQIIARSLSYNIYLLIISSISFFFCIPLNWIFISMMNFGYFGCILVLNLIVLLTVIMTIILLILKGYSSVFKPLPLSVIFTQSGIYEYFSIVYQTLIKLFSSYISIQLIMIILSVFVHKPTIAISVTVIMIEINLISIVHFSIANGIAKRIKNYIKNSCIYYAKRCVKIQIFYEICFIIIICIIYINLRNELPKILTDNIKIINMVSNLIIIALINQIMLAVYENISAIFKAIGYTKLCDKIVTFTQYFIALPLVLYVLFGHKYHYYTDTEMGIYIIWLGFTIGYLLADVLIIGILIYYVDWSKALNDNNNNNNNNNKNNNNTKGRYGTINQQHSNSSNTMNSSVSM